MEDVSTASLIYLIACVLLFYYFYAGGKKKYLKMLDPLTKDEFGLKDFFPAGFFLMEKLKYKYNSQYDRILRKNLKEIYDPGYVEFYLRVYWAASASYVLIGFLFSGLLALSGEKLLPFAGFCVGLVLAYVNLSSLNDKVEERHRRISMDMPDLTNKIVILSGAGMTLRAALAKIASEMGGQRPLYQELAYSMQMMENGTPAEAAFDHFMVRCNMPEIRRFVSIILQNMNRGGTDVTRALAEIGREQWENRKNAAKRFAEEASTKMLFPMMLMLLAVILLTITPAVLSMNV